MKKMLTVVLLLASHHALAQEWVTYSSARGETQAYNSQSLQRDGGLVTVWTRNIYDQPQLLDNGKHAKYGMAKTIVDCKNETVWFTSLLFYDESNAVVSMTNGAKPDVLSIPPGSAASLLKRRVCQ
ncbi:surface-adhesin E family protein [Paraburkholderia sacchari]|uniref:surface-adhesin E family protein n=1 Tax=Paraburkholderia sacchari TaxID=159450 RepID=UPI000542208E|nr:surface-adhesin E family protein [Paraburkholderia sacchari]NLP65520.1 hypothetical protein [Paraburkholderia sacchari]